MVPNEGATLTENLKIQIGSYLPKHFFGGSKVNFWEFSADRGYMLKLNFLTYLFLSPKGRIKRLPYLLGILPLAVISHYSSFIIKIENPSILLSLILFFLIMIVLWSFWALHIKRLHDVNLSGWFSLLVLIPGINFFFVLFLLFRKSVEPNKYDISSVKRQ